jgi:hypothetical protein
MMKDKKKKQSAALRTPTQHTTPMGEEERKFEDAFFDMVLAEFAPVGALETQLASSIVQDIQRWSHSIPAGQKIIVIDMEPSMDLDYTGALDRRIHANAELLMRMQDERFAESNKQLDPKAA